MILCDLRSGDSCKGRKKAIQNRRSEDAEARILMTVHIYDTQKATPEGQLKVKTIGKMKGANHERLDGARKLWVQLEK